MLIQIAILVLVINRSWKQCLKLYLYERAQDLGPYASLTRSYSVLKTILVRFVSSLLDGLLEIRDKLQWFVFTQESGSQCPWWSTNYKSEQLMGLRLLGPLREWLLIQHYFVKMYYFYRLQRTDDLYFWLHPSLVYCDARAYCSWSDLRFCYRVLGKRLD